MTPLPAPRSALVARIVCVGPVFPRVQRRLRPDHGGVRLERGKNAAGERRGAVGLRGAAGLDVRVFRQAPKGFVPQQDQGRIIASVQLPAAASLHRTQKCWPRSTRSPTTHDRAWRIPSPWPAIPSCNRPRARTSARCSLLETVQQARSPALRDTVIMNSLRRAWAKQIPDAQALVFGAPPVPGLSVAGGFKLVVEDPSGLGLKNLETQTNALVGELKKERGLVGVTTQFRSNTPQLYMDIDRVKTAALGVPLAGVNQTLSIDLGSLYVNSFNVFGRHWQVTSRPRASIASKSPTSICSRSETIKDRWCRWARWSTSARSADRFSSTATTAVRRPRSPAI